MSNGAIISLESRRGRMILKLSGRLSQNFTGARWYPDIGADISDVEVDMMSDVWQGRMDDSQRRVDSTSLDSAAMIRR